MRGSTMPTYTVSVTGAGALAPRFEQMLDVLPAAAMEGGPDTRTATLWFDVRAPHGDAAIEAAYLRLHGTVRTEDAVTITIARSHTVEGRRPWWRRVFAR